MIEVIYNKEDTDNKTNKIGIRLPKNIRQIGLPNTQKRIYIEDYVITYLNQLAQPSNTYSRGAILLGQCYKYENGQAIFISGALDAQNIELDLDEIIFNNEVWTDIYKRIQTYFPSLQVVGWFLSRLGFSVGVNDKIAKTHLDNFSGRDKVLYMIDALEGDDAFYLFEGNALRRQGGYYIYYERNEAMQSYMIDNKILDISEEKEIDNTIQEKDEKLLKNYRTVMKEKKELVKTPRRPVSLLYIASTCLTVGILGLGITVINNYDKMKDMQQTVNKLTLSMVDVTKETMATATEFITNTTVIKSEVTTEISTEEIDTTTETTTETATEKMDEEATTSKEANTEKKEKTTEVETLAKAEESNSSKKKQYYTIKEGDTLMSISKKFYENISYVDEIVSANKIEDVNTIFPGQKIIIPSVN